MSAATHVDDDVVQLPPSVFFNDKGGLVASRLGAVIEEAGHVKTGFDGRLYRYQQGVYLPDGETFVRVMVKQLLGDKVAKRHFEEVLAWLKANYPAVGDTPPGRWINCRNGLLDWKTGQLHPHNTDVYSTVQIPVDWRPDSQSPHIDRFLTEVLPDADTVTLIEEWAGYVLYPGNPFRLALLLLGPGRNGKSKLLTLLKSLAGPKNCAAVPLQDLAENRFAAAQLFGKLANICGDLDARAVKTTDTFKMATGGDTLTAERKHGQPFEFTPYATFLFGANEAPFSSDQSAAWFERWTVIPMEKRIPDDKIDPHLEAKITTENELSGFLVKAVDGLRRAMARGRFDVPEPVRQAGHDYRDRLDSVQGFLAEHCVLAPGVWVPRSALYKAYRAWTQESGRSALSSVSFNERIRRDHPVELVSEAARRGVRGWRGVGLIAEHHDPPDGGPSDAELFDQEDR